MTATDIHEIPANFHNYQEDTLHSLELMRNPETGLIRDKIQINQKADGKYSIKVLNNNTSATNIALDLINQMSNPQTLDRVISNLEKVQFHKDTGLFYSWYSTNKNLRIMSADVSSVDNIHLALALWTVKETYPTTSLAKRAETLFKRMDFSKFYDKATGLMGGNLRYHDGGWTLESYRFANLGSEARSIYSVAWALDLLKSSGDLAFPKKAIHSLTAEFLKWKNAGKVNNILKTWDGGAFQLLLPKLLLNEEKYSPILADSFDNYAKYILHEGKKRGYSVPAGHSASNYGVEGATAFDKVPSYHGKAGSPELVSTGHVDIKESQNRKLWDAVFTPHAAMMAATADPKEYGSVFKALENIKSGNNSLYQKGVGFMDGYHVKGTYQGEVVPVQLSLDQGMIALSLAQMKAKDGLSASGRALMKNKEAHQRMVEFYSLLDKKLAPIHEKLKD